MASQASDRDGLRQLQHDLRNSLNVLVGAVRGLLDTPLDDSQRSWLRLVQSATRRLTEMANHIDRYESAPSIDGRERLADLCSIAAARVGKPFDRERLVSAIEEVAGRRPLRILLVDDSPELAALVRSYLRDTPWTLDVVETGERAVAQATTEPYDVVLMDIGLPGLDGATAAHAIRAADLARGASPTPVIAMTAFDTPSAAPDRRPAPLSAARVVDIEDPEIAPLVPEFLQHRRDEVRQCREWLAAGEMGRIQSAAHKMKGTGRGYGFTEISRIAAALEEAAHHQDAHEARQLIDELDRYLHEVRVRT